MQGLKADIVFLDPVDTRTALQQTFSIFEDMSPNLIKLINKALKISGGYIALKFPGDINLDELPDLFNYSVGEDGM